jgi:ferrochelatase
MTRTGVPPGPQHLPEGHPAVRIGRIGVLLVNLGTPDGTGYWPMRRYLKEFLSDRRVIEEPRLKWWLILNLIILTVRPGRKGKDYAKIWNKQRNEGPLKTITRAQAEKLSAMLADERIVVDWPCAANPSTKPPSTSRTGLRPSCCAALSTNGRRCHHRATVKSRWRPAPLALMRMRRAADQDRAPDFK